MKSPTMYETIMDLPLFKGVGADHISSFLEKTKIEFRNFSPGEIIVQAGEEVKNLKFILSGEVEVSCEFLEGIITVTSHNRSKDVIGATRLFGLNTRYEVTLRALHHSGVMEFSKKKYLRLLNEDHIYLFNLVNLLSFQSQKLNDLINDFKRIDFSRTLAEWLVCATNQNSTDIIISGINRLKALSGDISIDSTLTSLTEMGFITVKKDCIMINDRAGILDYVCSFDNNQ